MSDSSTRRPAVRQRLLVALQVMLMVASLLAVAPVAAAEPDPSADPSATPSTEPSASPEPTPAPTAEPTPEPTTEPTPAPDPTAEPTAAPDPTAEPSSEPSVEPSPDATPEPTATPATIDYVVRFAPGTSAQAATDTLSSAGATVTRSIAPLRMWAISVPVGSNVVADLQANGTVSSVDLDRVREAEASPSDPSYPDQWSLPKIGWDSVFGIVDPAGSAVVALLDTGVDASHPDLSGQLVAGRSMLDSSTGTTDPNGHGTAMAGIIAARTDNAEGIAGIGYAGVKVMPVTVLDANGLGQDSDIIAGVVWAVDHGADVINMSFSNPGFSESLQAAIDYAWANDVVVVAATGNDGSPAATFPAGDRGVIGVSNTDQSDTLAPSSNYGPDVFLAAPGVGVVTTAPGGGTTSITGTSASSAAVAAAAALLRANDPSASNGVIVGRLARTAEAAGTIEQTGNGRLSIERAIADTSTEAVRPAGASPVGNGGPIVGPYVVAANNYSVVVSPSGTVAGTANSYMFTFTGLNSGGGAGTGTLVVPGGWTPPQTGAGAGHVAVTNGTCTAASLSSVVGSTITFNHNCGNGNTFTIQYDQAASPATTGDYTFVATPGNDPIVTTNADGSGTMTVNNTTATTGQVQTYTFTYTAAGTFSAGSQIDLTIPAGWTGATSSPGAGQVTVTSGTCTTKTLGAVTATTIPINMTCTDGQTVVFTYASATAPAAAGVYTFTAKSKLAGGSLVALAASPAVTVTGNGSGILTIAPTTGTAGTAQTYTFTYTPNGPSFPTGSQLEITIPAGWTAPTSAGGPGQVTVSPGSGGGSCSGGGRTATLGSITGQVIVVNFVCDGSRTFTVTYASALTTTAGVHPFVARTKFGAGSLQGLASGNPTVAISPAAASQLRVETAANGSGSSLGPQNVQSGSSVVGYAITRDTYGNFIANVSATWSLQSITGGVVAGNLVAAGDNKSAVFTGVLVGTAVVRAVGSFTGNSGTLTVVPGPAHHLAFGQQPSLSVAGQSIAPAVTVRVLDAAGNLVTPDNTTQVSLTFGSNPTSATLTGGSAQVTSGGTATFSGLSVNKAGTGFTLAASSTPSLTGATSTTFDITLRATLTSLTCATPVDAGATTSCIATVTDNNGAGASTPSGTVTFSTDGTGSFSPGATCTLTVTGTCSVDYTVPSSTLPTTDHIGAQYNGSATHAGSTATAVDVVVETHADLADLKSAVTTVIAGDTLIYTITVTNNGPSDAQGVSLADTLDSALTNPTWTLDTVAQGVWGGIAVMGPMTHGQTHTIVITATVDPSTAGGYEIENTANAASSTDDPDPGNNASETSTTVQSDVTLDLTKTFNSDTATAGGSSETFTITVTNTGALSTAHDVQVTDAVDPRLEVTYVDCSAFDTDASSGQSVDCTIGLLPAGDSATITVTYQVDTTTEAALAVSNTADAETADNGGQTASDGGTVDIVENVVLDLTKTFDSATATAGGANQTVTITVKNTGVSQADNVSVGDSVDTRLAVSAVTSSEFSCAAPSQTIDCDLLHLDAGATATIVVTYSVDTATEADPSVSNTASATADDGGADSDTDTVAIVEDVTLVVTKTFDSDTVTAGGAAQSFTISVKNTGVSQADTISLADTVDGRLIVGTITEGDYDCSASSGQTIDCSLLHLDAGAISSITVAYTVDTTTEAAPAVSNTAAADADDFVGPATGSDTVDIVEDVVLTVDKAFGDDPVTAGTGSHTFTITVTNAGVSEADSLTLADSVDGRLVVDSVTGDFTCTDPDTDAQTITCTLAHLAGAGTASLTVTYHVAADTAGASVGNTADADADDFAGPATGSDTIVIETHADVADLKTDSPDPVLAGNVLTYTITVTNNGPSDAQDVSLADPLDPALTGETWTLDTVAQGPWTGTALLGTMAPSTHHVIVITATVNPATPDTAVITNTATSTSTTDDPCDGIGEFCDNNSATETTDVDTEADLSISKAGPATATAGDPAGFDYTITVDNVGPSDNTGGFTVSDTLDTGLTFETVGSDSRCSATGQLVTCANATGLTVGAPADSFIVHVTLDQTIESGAILSNTATVASEGTLDPNAANDTSTPAVLTTVEENVVLDVTKTFGSDTVTAGGIARTVTIAVHNSGVSQADHVSLTDTLDNRLIVDSIDDGDYDCTASTGQTVDCSLAHLDAGSTKSITVTYHVDTTTEAALGVGNTASADADDFAGPATGSDTVDIVEDVTLAVTKSFGDDPVTAGTGSHTFTATITNSGVSEADNLTLTDTVDSRLVVDSVTGPFTCTDPDTNAQTITCTLANLVASGTASITVTYHVAANTTAATVSNTASADADDFAGPTTGSDTVAIAVHADVADLKTAAATVIAGNTLTYTITVTNIGPSDAQGVSLADTLDPHLTNPTYTLDGGSSLPWGGILVLGAMTPSQVHTIVITATVDPATPDGSDIENTANAASSTDDPNPLNNSSETTTEVDVQSDLSITKTDGVTTATPGSSVTYTITVSNAGPSDAVGASVADSFPAPFTSDSWTAVGVGGAAGFTAIGTGNISDTVDVPVGGSITYTVIAHISAAAAGSLANTASVTSGADVNTGNNSATDTDTLVPSAGLRITKTDGVTTATPGTSVTYTITVSNAGPSDAVGASVSDAFPSAITSTSWTALGTLGTSGFAGAGVGDIADTVTIPAGGSITYTVHANISSAATGTLSNTATVSSAADATPADNTAIDTDTLTPQADLSITKTDGVTTATPGSFVTYTIVVGNAGPSNVVGAIVSDSFPAPFTGDSWTAVATGGATGFTASGTGAISDTVTVPAGATITYTATANISAGATGSLSNTATVASSADTTPGNNSATDTDTLVPSANLGVSKTGPATGTAGGPFSYTIIVTNIGPSNAVGVVVTDATPASFSSPTFTVDAGPSNTWTGSTTLASLASGGTATVVITGMPTLATTIANQATVSATTADPASGNNTSATVSTVVSAGAANKLVFAQQPTGAFANDIIVPAVTAQVTDLYGNPTTAIGTVGLTMSAGLGTLSGTLPRTIDGTGLATFNDLSVSDIGTYTLTTTNTAGLANATSLAFNILPATTGLLADIATSDADFNHIDGFDVLFGNGSSSLKKLQATNPGTFHYELDLQNETGVTMHTRGKPLPPIIRNGVSIKDSNGGSTVVIITIPALPTNSGTPIPLSAQPFTNPATSAFRADGSRAVRAHPDDHSDDMNIAVSWAASAPSGNCLATSGITWTSGQPANNAIVKCVRVEGLEIPKKHEAHIHLNLEFALKGTDGWQTTAQTAFRAGFSFKSQTQVTLDADFPIASLANMTYIGNDAAGIVGAGQKYTAIGGFVFDTNGAGIPNANVKLFNSAPSLSTMCTTATPAASYATDPDGFYFIANLGVNVPSTPGNNLPYGIRYYVAVCDVPGVTPGYWPARYMSDKLGSKEFDEEDFYVSNPTHLGFSIQPTTNKLGRTMYTVQVALLDTWNNVVADDNTKVTVSINSGAGGVLSGTLQRTMSNGFATFGDLKISGAGTAGLYSLKAVDSTGAGSPHPFTFDLSATFTMTN